MYRDYSFSRISFSNKRERQFLKWNLFVIQGSSTITDLKSNGPKTTDALELVSIESPLSQQLLQIAEEIIIGKNKILSADLLYKCAQKRLKIPRRELVSVIQWLFGTKILVEGSKLTRRLLLKNHNRQTIYNFIHTNLAVTFSRLKKELSPNVGSPGQLIWHLQMLIKYDYIKRAKFKNYSLFMLYEMDAEIAILLFLLRDRINKQIIELFLTNDILERPNVYDQFSEGRQFLYYRINNLIDAGVLTFKEGSTSELLINPSKKERIIELLTSIGGKK